MDYYLYLNININIDDFHYNLENQNNFNIYISIVHNTTARFISEDYHINAKYQIHFQLDISSNWYDDFSKYLFGILNTYHRGEFLLLDVGGVPILLKNPNMDYFKISKRLISQGLNLRYLNYQYQIEELE